MIPLEDVTSDEEKKSSGEEDSNQEDSNLTHKVKDQRVSFFIIHDGDSSILKVL